MNRLVLFIVTVGVLAGCTPRGQDERMTGSDVMKEVETVLSGLPDISVVNRCAQIYAERKEFGGCYLSKAPSEDSAREVVAALAHTGFTQRGTLRLDFGRWTTVLDNGGFAASVSVDSLASTPGENNDQVYQQGYRSKVTVALTETGEQ